MEMTPHRAALGLIVLAMAAVTLGARLSAMHADEMPATTPTFCADPMRLPGATRLVCGVGLDPNRDPAADLELLPGIGPVKARRIVESRDKDGPFRSADDLDRVPGIGPATVEALRPWLVFPSI
jgi:competence protein ComEA